MDDGTQTIVEAMEREILQLEATAKLPSEPALMRRFGVSRHIVRKAVAQLETRFVVRRVQGAGTFVNSRLDYVLSLNIPPSVVLDSFDELGDDQSVRMVSLMDHTSGQRQYADIEAFRTYMVGKHRLTPEGFDEHVAQLHTRAAQYSAVNRIELASRARDRGLVLAAHDDATVDHVAESSALGVRISEFPTTPEAAFAARSDGQVVMMDVPNVVRASGAVGRSGT